MPSQIVHAVVCWVASDFLKSRNNAIHFNIESFEKDLTSYTKFKLHGSLSLETHIDIENALGCK